MINLIYRNWAKAGLLFSLFILAYIYLINKHSMPLLEKYVLLNLAFLMIHQFEEYVYPGTFKEYFNTRIYNPFGFFRNKLTDKGIFWVNVILGWGLNIAVLLFFRDNPQAVMTAIGIIFINGIMHFFTAFKTRGYNPGVVTAAIFFIPLGLYSFNKFYSAGMIKTVDILLIIVYSLLGSLMIPITIYGCREKRR
ncbi:MAG TPA: HXXEE domain-containing protein [Ignavibacteria bacterium]|nr:HXXEE domain-containing protein [Ignavibacteria bacterium]HMQ98829.1 HXXEE domain-containing protein [Ignavibacteria bacterium]